MLDNFIKTIASRRETDVIYLDFKKAFKAVPHKRLIGILKQYGIKEKTLGWMNKFLLRRRQRVLINDSRSEWKAVLSGIPQGSVLGPVLFVIKLNSMQNTVESKLYLFAEDARLCRKVISDKDVELLQEDLRKPEDWSKISLLLFNEEKCVHMITSNGRLNRERRSHETYNKHLETVGEEKKLGVIIDTKLSFDSDIFAKVKKQNLLLLFLRKHSINDYTCVFKCL